MLKAPSYQRKNMSRSQSLVEFALAIPFLMILMVGLLETGRLIFMVSTVTSASREAVRYGSAVGLNVTGGVPRYKDCIGIRNAAQVMDFLGVIDNVNIVIAFDHGPGSAVFSGCPPAKVVNGDRLKVTVSAAFIPTLGIIPFTPINLSSFSARSLVVTVQVFK